MVLFPPTVILRHRKENLKKCSLRGLEEREDCLFFTYPNAVLPDLSGYVLLAVDAPPLTLEESEMGLFLVDGTWRYAERMLRQLPSQITRRSIPPGYLTAYPRRQEEFRGLASIEALFIAYQVLGRDAKGLLDQYRWREEFLQLNGDLLRMADVSLPTA